MTRLTLKALFVLVLAVPVVAGGQVAHAKPPASEEYVFEGPNAGVGEGETAASTEDDGSDAAVPILIGVLVVTAATGAGIAIVRRQRT